MARPDDLQWKPCHGVRLDGEVDALVRHQRGDNEVEGRRIGGAWRFGRRVEAGVHGRIDHVAVAPVEVADALGDAVADADEAVHAVARASVPVAEPCEERASESAAHPVPQVLFAEEPCVAHRRETVADVLRAAWRPEALGDAVAVGEEQVGVGNPQCAGGKGHQRKEGAIVARDSGDALQEGA